MNVNPLGTLIFFAGLGYLLSLLFRYVRKGQLNKRSIAAGLRSAVVDEVGSLKQRGEFIQEALDFLRLAAFVRTDNNEVLLDGEHNDTVTAERFLVEVRNIRESIADYRFLTKEVTNAIETIINRYQKISQPTELS